MKEMTDEEMAEAYSTENWEYYEEGQNDSKALKQAYLAGLKAGRETKWHDLKKTLVIYQNLMQLFLMKMVIRLNTLGMVCGKCIQNIMKGISKLTHLSLGVRYQSIQRNKQG